MKTYSEKLKDPRWQRKRLEIMERDEFSCKLCGDDQTTLNVHHCFYGKRRDPWDYDNDHLITLCEHCHGDVERMREEILKELNWEIPIMSIHALATCGDPWLVAGVASAFRGHSDEGALRSRAKSIRRAISSLEEIAKRFELGIEAEGQSAEQGKREEQTQA